MTNQDIMDAWAKIYGRKEADRLVGAVGSSEPPPDPWRGISGPPGPLTPYGRRIASMQANLETHFGTAAIEWSEPNDPAAWAKPGTPVMQKLIEEIDQWSAVVRDRDAKISTDEREILVLRAERDAWKYLYETVKPDSDARMLKADETGNHDYIGPVKDGKAVPDPTHERFHGSVGDVIAGNVMRPARDQMERALADARVKDGKTPPPFPSAHAVPDHRRIGS